ncbi:MAG TPA: lysophospholipid acyltransferase family protein [Chthoniobacterales bacterium]
MPSDTAYHFWNTIAKGLLVGRVRVRVLHPERGAAPGAWILASNHISHFDPTLLSTVTRRAVDWMAMEELFRGRLAGAFYRGIGAFPVKRSRADRTALRTAIQRLEAGRVVGIFPEGGLRAGPASVLEGAPAKSGIALLSVLAQVPIQPCVVIGTDRLYRAKNWRPGPRIPVWMAFGERIQPDPALEKTEAMAKVERELAAAFLALKGQLIGEFGLTTNDLPQTPQHRKGEA